MSALAVVAARNEAGYIETMLRSLITDEGLEVVLIDHGSTDGTRARAEQFLGAGLLEIISLPWEGSFDLLHQLEAKRTVYERVQHDWVLHVDADEWPRSAEEMPLAEFLRRVDPSYQVVNFVEFVFVPPIGTDMWGRDYRRIATAYYAFAPQALRLQRAWRRSLAASNLSSGGHQLDVARNLIHPESQTLRHYIGLSWSHAIFKRASRPWAAEHLARGWAANRRDLSAAQPVTDGALFHVAEPWNARTLDQSCPSRLHFWESGFAEANRRVKQVEVND